MAAIVLTTMIRKNTEVLHAIEAIHTQLDAKYNLLSEVQQQKTLQTVHKNVNKLFYYDLYKELERIQQNEWNPTMSRIFATKIEWILKTRIAIFDYTIKKHEMRDISSTTYFQRIRAFLLREKKPSLFSYMEKDEIIQLVDDESKRMTVNELTDIIEKRWFFILG